MDESKAPSSPLQHSRLIQMGQLTILSVYDDMVDAAATLTLLLFPRQPQPQPCYCHAAPPLRREERHVWIGLE